MLRVATASPLRLALPPPHRLRRTAVRRRCSAAAAVQQVDVESCRRLLDQSGMLLDVRPAAEYDASHITKPARRSVSVPLGEGGDAFVARAAARFPNQAAQIVVVCSDGGQDSTHGATLLSKAGYTGVAQLQGGYAGYTQVWGPSGKRRPPAGRWVSTGKEALKSGINIPGAAESYEEGGNLRKARFAQGLEPGQVLPPS